MLTRKGVWILDSGFWILDSGFWILDSGFWILDSGFWILDSGFWVSGFLGFWVSPVSLPRHDPSIVQATRRLHPCIHPGTIRRSSRPQDAGVLSSPIRKVQMIGKRFRWPGVALRQETKHIYSGFRPIIKFKVQRRPGGSWLRLTPRSRFQPT